MSLRGTLRACLPLCAIGLGTSLVAWSAHAGGGLADRARALLAQIEASSVAAKESAAKEPVAKDIEPATSRAVAALNRAGADPLPAQAELHEAAALEWAEVARDLIRARESELASDQLERELSALHTELVRSRAAVEQAVARVGRARQGLAELEAAAGEQPAPGKAVPGKTAPGKGATSSATTSAPKQVPSGKDETREALPTGQTPAGKVMPDQAPAQQRAPVQRGPAP